MWLVGEGGRKTIDGAIFRLGHAAAPCVKSPVREDEEEEGRLLVIIGSFVGGHEQDIALC